MEDWLRTAAQSLGVDAIDDDMQERLLGVARDVAHGVERKITPLATFLLGEAVQRRVTSGEERAVAFSAAVGALERAIDADHDA